MGEGTQSWVPRLGRCRRRLRLSFGKQTWATPGEPCGFPGVVYLKNVFPGVDEKKRTQETNVFPIVLVVLPIFRHRGKTESRERKWHSLCKV